MKKKMNPEWETMFLENKEQKQDSIELKRINTNKNEIGIEAFDYFKDEINKSKKRNDNLFIENINQKVNYLNKKNNNLIVENKQINERLKHLDKKLLNLKKMALEINQIENKISKNIKYLTSTTKPRSPKM
ncbi:MAG: hypothetical protein H9Q65_00560 [Spiroplasma ixodetis]|nr:hypothetical protein [Spiroplasma ixodetis]MBP1526428.1 hypothetical protein [Spiroplasma ixodetis]MBP1527737.1 hypothetical protein [Spiroplasma ixodetis]